MIIVTLLIVASVKWSEQEMARPSSGIVAEFARLHTMKLKKGVTPPVFLLPCLAKKTDKIHIVIHNACPPGRAGFNMIKRAFRPFGIRQQFEAAT